MFKRIIGSISLAIILCTFVFSLQVNAYDPSFYIKSYNVKINVGLDNSYSVTEALDIDYTSFNTRHGFYRNIPLKNSQTGGNVTISDIKVIGEKFTVSDKSNNRVITIADMSKFVNGLKHYEISYKFSPGKDIDSSADYLLYNVIPFGFDVPIKSAFVEITMPKEFDASKIKIFSGDIGTTTNDLGISKSLIGNKIVLRSTNSLGPLQGITAYSILPEGYFSEAAFPIGYFLTLFIPLISIPLILLALYLWKKYGKDEAVIPVISFSPPRGYNPAEIGYLLDQTVDNEDIASLTIYWASHGHLTIEEIGSSYILHMVSPLDDKHKPYEQKGFLEMFALGTGEAVTKEDLENKYFATANDMKKQVPLYYDTVQPSLYEKSSLVVSYAIMGLAFLVNVLILFIPTLNYGLERVIMVFAGISIALFIAISVTCNWYSKIHFKINMLNKVLTIIAIVLLSLVFIGVNFLFNSINGMWIWPPLQFFVLNITVITLIFLSMLIKKKSKYMQEVLQEILGFKNFLETAEKDKIELLVKDNPKYFFDILPYTIVLGVTDVWGKKFNDIVKEPPDWYQNRNGDLFMPSMFAISMMNYNRSMSSAVVSTPSNTSGRGFSGGGFSGGGGFGGGGFGGGGGGGV